jgi:hypothetical protein
LPRVFVDTLPVVDSLWSETRTTSADPAGESPAGFNLRASSDVPTPPDQRAFDHFTLKAKFGSVSARTRLE